MIGAKDSDFDHVFDSQHIFRVLLNTMAKPGKIGILPSLAINPPEENPYPFLVLLALLDREVSFSVQGNVKDPEKVMKYLELNTGSKPGDLGTSDFIFVYGGSSKGQVCRAKTGSFRYPDKSATIVYAIDSISDPTSNFTSDFISNSVSDRRASEKEKVLLELSGPGIKEKCMLAFSGIEKKEIQDLISVREFPLGIDAMFCDKKGRIVGIPRSSSVKIS
ncbi:MAG: phosphonate C-P lyase system protein PhnH [Methanosarcina sp.]